MAIKMTAKDAVNKILEEYHAGEEWRPHFERIVNRFIGESNSLSKETFEMVRQYLRNIK